MSKPLTDEQRLDHKETLNSRFTLSIEEQQELLASEEAGWKEAEKWRSEALKQCPTPDAYEAACKALWIHRGNSEMLRAEVWKLEEKLLDAFNTLKKIEETSKHYHAPTSVIARKAMHRIQEQ